MLDQGVRVCWIRFCKEDSRRGQGCNRFTCAVVHCYTLSFCYLGVEMIITEIQTSITDILVGQLTTCAVTSRLGRGDTVGRSGYCHRLWSAGVLMVDHSIANLTVELVGADVGLDEVVGAPLDGLLQVLHLSSCFVTRAIRDTSVSKHSHSPCHWVAKLDIVSGWKKKIMTKLNIFQPTIMVASCEVFAIVTHVPKA